MQKTLKEGRLKFGEWPKMQVDSDPQKVEEALYFEPLECMLVETIDGLMESLDVVSLAESFEVLMVKTTDGFDKRARDGLESAYPQVGENLTNFQEKRKVSGSKAIIYPKCSDVFDEKATERLEDDKNKASEEEKHVVPRFMFDKCGAPRRNEEYRRQFQQPRPKTFLPPSDIPQEKWVESVH